jgi:hypothetical protein
MQYLYHVLSLREPVFIRPAKLGGIQQVFFIKGNIGVGAVNPFNGGVR